MADHVHMLLSMPPKDHGVERGGLHQRKERDPYSAALYEAREELRRAGILGTRVFRG